MVSTFIVLFSTLSLVVSVVSLVAAYMYKQNVREEMSALKTKILKLESDNAHFETRYRILSDEHHELLKKWASEK